MLIFVVVAIVLGMYGCNSYNGLVGQDVNVQNAWANVQSQYQRRADLIPNLVNTVKGAADFEMQPLGSDEHLFEKVIRTVSQWGNENNLMFVAGATQASELENIRSIIPNHFLLVPGVGFQGGNLEEVSKYGMNKDCGLLVNASRAIIYAGEKENFAEEARAIAEQYQVEMAPYLQ